MIFDRVQKLICEQFDLEPENVTEDTTLEEVDADSLDIYDMAQTLETEFEVIFNEKALEELCSVGDIVRYIESN